ncbi:GatB/YqeY domain-containing protein [Corynebacterium choanae]|uniref:Yqey-like protein n=1 Tax=Corynebacterium choanae TaxID=1862358 RepID=A0A3G6JD43_9CORY|nr:GatB/YqeY domain-containing protein [Corynebacterium choanae]AZA14580.1 Yqey-like protein [Corynebacterium choanae]
MSELTTTIRADLKQAMKDKDEVTKRALRMLLASIQTESVSGSKHEVDDAAVKGLIAREIKKRNESAEVYAQNGRDELAAAEREEAAVFSRYLPAQFTDEELDQLVESVVADVFGDDQPSMRMMGQVMQKATAKADGRVDGKRLSTAVKRALGGN